MLKPIEAAHDSATGMATFPFVRELGLLLSVNMAANCQTASWEQEMGAKMFHGNHRTEFMTPSMC